MSNKNWRPFHCCECECVFAWPNDQHQRSAQIAAARLHTKMFHLYSQLAYLFSLITILDLHTWLLQKCKNSCMNMNKCFSSNKIITETAMHFTIICNCFDVYVCGRFVFYSSFVWFWFGLMWCVQSTHTCQFNVIMKTSRFQPIRNFKLHIKMVNGAHSTSQCNV